MGGGSDNNRIEATSSAGDLVTALAWTIFGAIMVATILVSTLAFREVRDNFRALSRSVFEFQEQVSGVEAGFKAQGPPSSSPPIHSDGAPRPRTTWLDEDGAAVTDPDWLERPSGEDLARYYPSLAMALGIQGRVLIECRIDVEGRLRDCNVLEEAPARMGFGAATMEIAQHFRMTPQLRDGKPVDGARIRLPISWRLG